MCYGRGVSTSFDKPYFVGIAGGTGSGKTTVAQRLLEGLPEGSATILQHDCYYRHDPTLSHQQRGRTNFDHPDALDHELLIRHLDILSSGEPVDVPVYDFQTHLRSDRTVRHQPVSIVIVEGILNLVDPGVRRRMDLKLFVDTDADIRLMRRIRRDMDTRGRSFEQIRDQYYATVRPMHLRFVEPSKTHADLIIPEGGENKVALDMVLAKLRSDEE